MPPRYAYWTILIGDEPTAFRAREREELEATFKRLQARHGEARMVWFQNGKVWNSRLDAQEAMKVRGDRGRARDFRQRETLSERRPPGTGGHRESKGFTQREQERKNGKLEWKPKGSFAPAEGRSRRSPTRPPKPEGRRWEGEGKLDWKPKGTFAPAAARPRPDAERKSGKLEWKPKGTTDPADGRSRRSAEREGGPRPKRDKTWRPGGEHRDPRQKYKDAKKAKWGRFKQTIRKRWESKQTRKKKDGE